MVEALFVYERILSLKCFEKGSESNRFGGGPGAKTEIKAHAARVCNRLRSTYQHSFAALCIYRNRGVSRFRSFADERLRGIQDRKQIFIC